MLSLLLNNTAFSKIPKISEIFFILWTNLTPQASNQANRPLRIVISSHLLIPWANFDLQPTLYLDPAKWANLINLALLISIFRVSMATLNPRASMAMVSFNPPIDLSMTWYLLCILRRPNIKSQVPLTHNKGTSIVNPLAKKLHHRNPIPAIVNTLRQIESLAKQAKMLGMVAIATSHITLNKLVVAVEAKKSLLDTTQLITIPKICPT